MSEESVKAGKKPTRLTRRSLMQGNESPASSTQTYLILGAGVAAASAADTLRSNGFDGRLIVIGAEPDVPYNRPALSKERLRDEVTDEQTLLHPAEYYRTQNVELVLDQPVTRVELVERRIYAGQNASWAYDKLLIVTGRSEE